MGINKNPKVSNTSQNTEPEYRYTPEPYSQTPHSNTGEIALFFHSHLALNNAKPRGNNPSNALTINGGK
jgi:hypothetical protein